MLITTIKKKIDECFRCNLPREHDWDLHLVASAQAGCNDVSRTNLHRGRLNILSVVVVAGLEDDGKEVESMAVENRVEEVDVALRSYDGGLRSHGEEPRSHRLRILANYHLRSGTRVRLLSSAPVNKGPYYLDIRYLKTKNCKSVFFILKDNRQVFHNG